MSNVRDRTARYQRSSRTESDELAEKKLETSDDFGVEFVALKSVIEVIDTFAEPDGFGDSDRINCDSVQEMLFDARKRRVVCHLIDAAMQYCRNMDELMVSASRIESREKDE